MSNNLGLQDYKRLDGATTTPLRENFFHWILNSQTLQENTMFQTIAKINKIHCQISSTEIEGRKRAEKLLSPSWQYQAFTTWLQGCLLNSLPQVSPTQVSVYYHFSQKTYFTQRKGISLRKRRVAKILPHQPTSTKPWNSQQMAGFAILLALPTLWGI